jgi:hypothetical protein
MDNNKLVNNQSGVSDAKTSTDKKNGRGKLIR